MPKGELQVMNRMRAFAFSLVIVASSLLPGGQAQAAPECHTINARADGQDLGGGATQAHVIGGGLLHGTTDANFVITDVSGTQASIAGSVRFTTNKATLTVSVSGTFDISSGVFSASGPVTASTGKLAGATGNLSFNGIENVSNGSFVEDIAGSICLG
jgi:hypothetical protein